TMLESGCRNGLVTVDGTDVAVRLIGTAADAERREGMPFELCGAGLRLTAGPHEVRTSDGRRSGIDVDRVVLSSAAGGAPAAVAQVAEGSPNIGTEVRAGAPTVDVTASDRDHATVRITGADAPFWFVLGQSDNAGWRASADGTDLGPSTLVDGYANGWVVRPDSTGGSITVSVRWTPQRVVDSALAISAGVFVLALAIILWTGVRIRRRRLAGSSVGVEAEAVLAPSLMGPIGSPGPARPGPAVIVGVPVVAGLIAGVFVQPWAAPILAVATCAALWWPRARALLRLFPAAAIALCGLYILVQQHRHRFAPRFEWPTFFGRVNQLAWLAVVALAADALIEMVVRRREHKATLVPDRPPAETSSDQPTGTRVG
ncbi:MAG: hypothetical protein ACXW2C_12500, partial [Acidimicrobiia bacterium]